MRESELQKSCIDYLGYKGIFSYKINNVGIKKPDGSYIPSQTKGLPDLVIHRNGRVEYIEFKSEKGRLSEWQEVFRKQCEKDGIVYNVIRSLDELIKIMEDK